MLTPKGTEELTIKRLKLRRFTVDDAQDMFNNWASDAEVTKFVSWPPHSTPDLTRELLGKWVEEYEKSDYYQAKRSSINTHKSDSALHVIARTMA